LEDPCFPNPKKKDLENTRDNYKVDVEDAVNSIDLNDNQLFTNAIFKLQSTINITTLKKNKILFVSLFQLCVKNLKADNKKIEINT
jgi:Zn-dependent M16 (insulinase) family peptidase